MGGTVGGDDHRRSVVVCVDSGELDLVAGLAHVAEEDGVGGGVVDDGVRSRSQRWVTDLERDGGDVADTAHEAGAEIVVRDVQNGRVEDGAGVVDVANDEAVGERGDVQHVEQRGLGHADLVSLLDEVDIVDDLDGSLLDLGGDVERLEERGLLGAEPGVLGGHDDVQGRESTGLSGGPDLVGQEVVADGDELFLGEDEADVAPDVREQPLEVGVVLQVAPDGLAHHGVLAHEDDSLAAEGDADLLHLLRANIVGVDQEALGVLIEELNELGEVVRLPGGLVLPHHLVSVVKGLRKSKFEDDKARKFLFCYAVKAEKENWCCQKNYHIII